MGTLFEQTQRIENAFSSIDAICKEISDLKLYHKLTFDEAMEVIKLSVQIADYDAKDEQLAGFGEILEHLVESYSSLKGME